ncbi:MAG: IclR family transcriptional regulator [Deferrisomatales bacterium]|nr:IclR family transcriptional regulator [Deferrisomatales bacterium]
MAKGPGVRPEGRARYTVRAIERAISILNAFSFDERELSLGSLTEKTALSKPTVFRILSTLESHGYVSQDPARGSYRLGSKFLELGGLALSSVGPRNAARPHLDRLRAELRVTILFGVLIDDQLVYVDKRESEGPIRIVSDVGLRRNPNYGMLGMALMAFLEDAEAERLLARFPLEPYTRFSLTDPEAFRRRLREVRREGYAVETNEAIEGVWGVAAPVRDARREVVAAVGAASPLGEKSERRVAEVTERVRACACAISEAMGFPAD